MVEVKRAVTTAVMPEEDLAAGLVAAGLAVEKGEAAMVAAKAAAAAAATAVEAREVARAVAVAGTRAVATGPVDRIYRPLAG